MSVGRRSRRVESTCPNFTKIGPSASSALRSLTARGVVRRPGNRMRGRNLRTPRALVFERQLVEPESQPDRNDAHQAE